MMIQEVKESLEKSVTTIEKKEGTKKAEDESKESYLAKLIGDDDKEVKESLEKSVTTIETIKKTEGIKKAGR